MIYCVFIPQVPKLDNRLMTYSVFVPKGQELGNSQRPHELSSLRDDTKKHSKLSSDSNTNKSTHPYYTHAESPQT
ncbi:hypothetical protein BH11BAC1_BH11BAC1_21320 [soil metagenome]